LKKGNCMNRKNWFWIVLWVVLFVLTGYLAFAYHPFGKGYGHWHGWGRPGGWDGPGYPAYQGRSWNGMLPGWMMGRGWSDSERGMDQRYGIMGPDGAIMPGMGFGMAGGWYSMMPWRLSDLTQEQAEKIGRLQSDMVERNRDVMQQIWRAHARLNSLYGEEKRDWNAIHAAAQKLFDLKRQQFDAIIDLQQKIDGLLTETQRQEMARTWQGYGWLGAQ
jgi:Spy/CpxP family protein refolding chaperone